MAELTRRDFLKATGIAVAWLGVGGLVEGCAPAFIKKEGPIKIGDIEPLTGPYAAMGQDQRDGAIFATEEFNAKGGVLGREVKIITEDDESKPATGLSKANKLLDNDQVHFLNGVISSAVALALNKLAWERKVIFMGNLQYADELTTVNAHPYYFRVVPSATMYARSSGAWIAEKLGKTWHFITADYAWGHSSFNAMKAVIEAKGGKIIGNELVPLGTADFSSQLLKVQRNKPDIVCVIEVGADAVNALKQILEFGLHKQMQVTGPAMMYEDAVAVSPHFVGYWGIEWVHTIDTKENKEWVERYQKRFKYIPTTHSWAGYIGVSQVLLAMERAKSTDPKKVIKALEGHELSTQESLKGGKTYWRQWDHQLIQDVYLIKAKNPAAQRKNGDYDLFEVLGKTPGEDVAHTRQESPAKMVEP